MLLLVRSSVGSVSRFPGLLLDLSYRERNNGLLFERPEQQADIAGYSKYSGSTVLLERRQDAY